MRQLTDMFKEVVGVEDGPQQMKKMFSSSDLSEQHLYVYLYISCIIVCVKAYGNEGVY